jgi:hypothetical protein
VSPIKRIFRVTKRLSENKVNSPAEEAHHTISETEKEKKG